MQSDDQTARDVPRDAGILGFVFISVGVGSTAKVKCSGTEADSEVEKAISVFLWYARHMPDLTTISALDNNDP
jgi:hypothetical protein